MKKLNFEEITKKISNDIYLSKDRIYATHLLEFKHEIKLPDIYLNALSKSICKNKKRILFGDKKLCYDFNLDEKFFTNYFSKLNYIRMILIDNEVYFKYGDSYYNSNNGGIVKIFELYFINLLKCSSTLK